MGSNVDKLKIEAMQPKDIFQKYSFNGRNFQNKIDSIKNIQKVETEEINILEDVAKQVNYDQDLKESNELIDSQIKELEELKASIEEMNKNSGGNPIIEAKNLNKPLYEYNETAKIIKDAINPGSNTNPDDIIMYQNKNNNGNNTFDIIHNKKVEAVKEQGVSILYQNTIDITGVNNLLKKADELGIENYWEMTVPELREAIDKLGCIYYDTSKTKIIDVYIERLKKQKEIIPFELYKESDDYRNFTVSYTKEEWKEIFENSKYSTGKIDYGHCLEYYGENAPSPYEFIDAYYKYIDAYAKERIEFIDETGKNCTINYKLVLEGGGTSEPSRIDTMRLMSELEATNPEYAKLYNYIYKQKGYEEANKYLDSIKETLNQIKGQMEAAEFLESLKNVDGAELDNIIYNRIKTVGKGLGDGVESWYEGIEAWFSGDEVITVEQYESMYILMALSSEEEKKKQGLIVEDKKGKYVSSSDIIDFTQNYGGDSTYKYSQAIGNMAPSIALSFVNPTLGRASLGVSAGGQNYQSALEQGYSKGIAFIYGGLTGLSSITLEKLLGGIPGIGKFGESNSLILKMVSEGFEEGLEELVQQGIWDNILLGKPVDIGQLGEDMVQSMIDGSIISGILGSPQTILNIAINGVNYTLEQSELYKIRELIEGGVSPKAAIGQVLGITEDINNIKQKIEPAKDIVEKTVNNISLMLSTAGNIVENAVSVIDYNILNIGNKLAQSLSNINSNVEVDVGEIGNVSLAELNKNSFKVRNSKKLSKTISNVKAISNCTVKVLGGSAALLAGITLSNMGPIGITSGITIGLKGINVMQNGIMNNNIKNSMLMVHSPKISNGKISEINQNLFSYNDFIRSRFTNDKQEYFMMRSINAFQQLDLNTKYSTFSQANTYLLLRKLQQLGFIKNLSKKKSDKKNNLALERFALGVNQRKNKGIIMYDISFETTDKKLSVNDIESIIAAYKVDPNKYTCKIDKNGNLIYDLKINKEMFLKKINYFIK